MPSGGIYAFAPPIPTQFGVIFGFVILLLFSFVLDALFGWLYGKIKERKVVEA